jgi:hypothetical protein
MQDEVTILLAEDRDDDVLLIQRAFKKTGFPFTSSELPEDVNRAFDLGANSYIVKPTDFNKLQKVGRHLEEYWLKVNRCPDYAPGNGTSSRRNP